MKTGVVAHPIFLEHDTGEYHPETSRRLESIYAMLDLPEMEARLTRIEPREAKEDELAWIHTRSYISEIASTKNRGWRHLDADTPVCDRSYDAALMAAGGGMEAVRKVMEGELDNAFALVRPPGHHAEASRAMGFCLFNNIAVAASYALKTLGGQRVLIVDWDLHHGNGTQNSFYDRSDVFYISTHQFPYYPGSGDFLETGYAEGEGFTMNFPLSPGFGSGDFLQIFERIIRPVALEYDPDLVLVSAGFDTYEMDPLGAMRMTAEGYGQLARVILEIAEATCGGKVVFFLEGGYHIEGQTQSVRNVLTVESASPDKRPKKDFAPDKPEMLEMLLERVIGVHRDYWTAL